jgi:NADPH-dependent curcumin reductase CurA
MQGFIVFDYAKEYPAALAQIGRWLGEGKLKRKETIIKGGVAASEEAFKQLFQGGNIGKSQSASTQKPATANP